MPNTWKTLFLEPSLVLNANDLPVLACYITRERRNTFGDGVTGIPDFRTELTMVFAGSQKLDVPEGSQTPPLLEDWMARLDDVLLRNPKFVNLTEGILSMDRTSQIAKVAETPVYEIRLEMVMQYTDYFEPIIPDDYLTMHVESRYPTAQTDPAEVQQVVAEYDVDQNARTAEGRNKGADDQGVARKSGRGNVETSGKRRAPQ
jgi:hypothetical protein